MFLNNQGFPDPSDNYDHLLQSIDGGPVLRKLRHPMPNLNGPINLHFDHPFVPAEHKDVMRKQVHLSRLESDQQEQVSSLIREFWQVFDERGVFIPVKNYECIINTGTARPIAVKKILYGEQETVIMQRCILALAKVGHIQQITDGRWLLKALLAAKPHQEHVHNIEDFVWRFYVNSIPLNGITPVIAYPIPQCNSAVFNGFGQGSWMWMFDAPMGALGRMANLK